jgi:N-acetylmuramoyl-L-alanine amidase
MSLIHHYQSPNFDERPNHQCLDLIIIHYTGMEKVKEALTRLCDPLAKVSAHYLIDQKGQCYQLVDDQKRAWHAGVSYWQGIRDINGISLGIELDNGGHDGGLPFFPESQIQALVSLLISLSQKYHINKKKIIGHSDVAPLRKMDPGELFPWLTLHQYGFGLWPASTSQQAVPQSIFEVQKILRIIGYDCPLNGIIDHQTEAVIRAFQRHFTPNEITGTLTSQLKDTLSCFET